MEYRIFGNTGLKVSELTLGTWVFGHGQNMWKEAYDVESYSVMKAAADIGINHVATARYGNAETVVGEGFKGLRDKVYFATSTGANATTVIEAEKQLDGALKALQTNYLDFYYLHNPYEGFLRKIEIMNTLRDKGKVKHLGVSNFSQPQLAEALKVVQIDFIQSPYNILWREIEEDLLPFCHEQSIAVTTYSSIAQGVLTGKYRSYEDVIKGGNKTVERSQICKRQIFHMISEVIKLVEEIAAKYNKTPAQVSLRWLLEQEGVTTAIVGARTLAQLEDNIGAVGWKLEKDDWQQLNVVGKVVNKQLDYNVNMWGDPYYRGLE